MQASKQFQFTNSVLLVPLFFVLAIWVVFLVEIRLGINFNKFGVYPRTLSGLRGIVFSPFIHGSAQHLYNNTVPLAVLTASLFYFYRKNAFYVLAYGILLSGIFTWLIGRESYHIGASGLIYVLASFIFFKGIFTKYYRLVALSLMVVFVYGSMLWYIFPIQDDISWEGHLSGFLVGFFFAYYLKTPIPELKKYDWERDDYKEEEDEFLQHFDENGNFIERTPEPEMDLEVHQEIVITYHYKENEKPE
ncbi:rhomboid family intramembrane serine protease [Cellulophaga baltica]|uniref:Membrane protein n=1 Tax=Cellulophaga baltica 18 TaxID=1348584 RepID=A0AAU8RLA8_9FLAO|nr:rhomboid family intramembrane serine protease [Cellulophaga baltica]AIZ40292.1 membrane protein [Cellulophaga baltica 18]MBA6314273.1 rhomboid family intramembrane serine protease [Cellulophaga baltica]WFO15701.1 rhomboid family intramembrane serine protease [Cellulophaga baltica 4]